MSAEDDSLKLEDRVSESSTSKGPKDEEKSTQVPEVAEVSTLPPPPPNGGLTAWLQVIGCHILFFNSWGIVNTFGAYQAFYQTHQLASSSPSAISWIGTIQGFLMIVIGVFTGPLYDMGYLRTLMYTGTFLIVFGLMMASISTDYYQVFLSMGVCVGLGSGCLFIPSAAIVSQWFSTKRGAAVGLAATGGSLGGVIYPIIFRRLVGSIGYGWATRIIAFLALATLSISLTISKARILPAKKRSLIDYAALKDVPFMVFTVSLFVVFVGFYIPFFYMPWYAEQTLDTSQDLAFYLLSAMNGASVVGRVGPNILSDKVGPLNIMIPFTFISGILAFAWIRTRTFASVVVFCILYGFFSGAIVALLPTSLIVFCPDIRVLGARMGMCFSFLGLGVLIGSPIAGVLLDSQVGFHGLKAFCGIMVIVGSMATGLAYYLHLAGAAKRASRIAA
ncbi:hypothetical protein G7Y89_g14036 [Cudoniella acicularis]|uniref:Major facilitator superfamily (MFS) profile domain-containing protein n=1 Tax=Cudoniella acicularis TaxID=354080 RepID=A0A8H4R6C6_9HELO|nr:hypothetical protein G7Y89_g14036 [Cudoniella acicularis]